jgi:death-on-curing protein
MASIESAVGRPYTGYYRTIHKKAAAIIQSFVKNHGFVDGNKRTALALLLLFLERSGYRLAQEPAPLRNQEIEQMILDVCESRMEFPELEIWFKERIESLP